MQIIGIFTVSRKIKLLISAAKVQFLIKLKSQKTQSQLIYFFLQFSKTYKITFCSVHQVSVKRKKMNKRAIYQLAFKVKDNPLTPLKQVCLASPKNYQSKKMYPRLKKGQTLLQLTKQSIKILFVFQTKPNLNKQAYQTLETALKMWYYFRIQILIILSWIKLRLYLLHH